jgi:hypothetical protein
MDVATPAGVNAMLRATPGAVAVSYGGVAGHGHYQQIPANFGDEDGVIGSVPSVVVADEYFPSIGLCEADGDASGAGEDIVVGDFLWNIRGIEPGDSPGEVQLLLSNRRSNTDG